MAASWSVAPSTESSTSTTTSARSIARFDCIALTRSTAPDRATLPGRRMPAVSTIRNCRFRHCISVSMASRVVPGMRTDQDALLAQHAVDERGLADVRPADNRHRRFVGALVARGFGISRLAGVHVRRDCVAGGLWLMRPETEEDLFEQVADSPAVLRGDLDHRVEAQPVELERPRLGPPVVGLVDRHHDRLARRRATPRPPPGRRAVRRRRRPPRTPRPRPPPMPGGPARTPCRAAGPRSPRTSRRCR